MKAFSDVMVVTGRKKHGLKGQMESNQGTLRDLCCMALVFQAISTRQSAVSAVLVTCFWCSFLLKFTKLWQIKNTKWLDQRMVLFILDRPM